LGLYWRYRFRYANTFGKAAMARQFILSFIADNRPGLVDTLSGVVTESGGNWLESRMAHLAEKFAGIVQIELPDERQAELLRSRMAALESTGIVVAVSEVRQEQRRLESFLAIDLVGADHPGIVHDITHCLSLHRVSIELMDTSIQDAPMGGGKLFHAHIEARKPEDLNEEVLRNELEKLAAALVVDFELREIIAGQAAATV
jgi:glycine cleavage system regulatory protein